MKMARQARTLGTFRRVALVLAAAAGLATGAMAQGTPDPVGGKPLRIPFPTMDIPGSYKETRGWYAAFPPGFKSPTSFHAGEETGYVIAGDFILTLEGQPPQHLKPGDPYSIPRGVRHGFTTVGGAKIVAFWALDKGLPLDLSPEKQDK